MKICPKCLDVIYWDYHDAMHCHVMRIEMEEAWTFRHEQSRVILERMEHIHESWFLVDHAMDYEEF